MNSLFQQLQGTSLQPPQQNPQKLPFSTTQLNNLKTLLSSKDPQTLVQSLIKNNPKLNNIYQVFKMSGMSPKQFFYQQTQQNGIDPNQILNTLQQ